MKTCIICRTKFHPRNAKQITCLHPDCQNARKRQLERRQKSYDQTECVRTKLNYILYQLDKDKTLVTDKSIKKLINRMYELTYR